MLLLMEVTIPPHPSLLQLQLFFFFDGLQTEGCSNKKVPHMKHILQKKSMQLMMLQLRCLPIAS